MSEIAIEKAEGAHKRKHCAPNPRALRSDYNELVVLYNDLLECLRQSESESVAQLQLCACTICSAETVRGACEHCSKCDEYACGNCTLMMETCEDCEEQLCIECHCECFNERG